MFLHVLVSHSVLEGGSASWEGGCPTKKLELETRKVGGTHPTGMLPCLRYVDTLQAIKV